MEGFSRLNKDVTAASAAALKSWSDRYSDHIVPLRKIIDNAARFIINSKLKTNRKNLGLTEEEIAQWYDEWDHVKLAKYVSKIWNDEPGYSTHMTIETAFDNLEFHIDS